MKKQNRWPNTQKLLGMVMHTFNPSTYEAEAGIRLLQVQGQFSLHNEYIVYIVSSGYTKPHSKTLSQTKQISINH